MKMFYIDVELRRGPTRLQVDEVPPEQWDLPYTPQFIIEFHQDDTLLILTLQLEDGFWSDCTHFFSPLDEEELRTIGHAISNHMVVALTTYMGLFVPQYPNPTLN